MNLTQNIDKSIFREYDLRGIYGENITEDVAYTLGKSFGTYIKKLNERQVLVGYDNRLSSPSLNNSLIKGICDSGVDVISLGLVTTPMYYFSRYHYGINTGIMITASHNPKDYNGFKIAFSSIGNAYGQLIKDFRDFTLKGEFDTGTGNVIESNIRENYINKIIECLNIGERKVKAVLDCGNGTGSIIIKDIFDKLGIEYYPLYCESDGNFPNHHPDPSVKENMQDLKNKVLELGYDLGIGIDGDADRVGIVDNKGNILGADLYMIIMYRALVNNLKNKKALYDVKCSRSLIDELDKLGIEKIMYRTGNSYINMMMKEGNFDFGGEYSGHVFFRDKFPGFDDGIYAGLRMIELLSNSDKDLSSFLDGINKYYSTEEIKFEVTEENKFAIVEKVKEYAINQEYNIIDIDGVRVEFYFGWALVRASNTGPNITARFEANSLEKLNDITEEFTKTITKFINK